MQESSQLRGSPVQADSSKAGNRLSARLWSRKAAAMLGRNTVVSCCAFVFDLALLSALVGLHWSKLNAAALGFVAANTLHYALGRSWIFRGTQRGIKAGYLLFLVNAAIGLVVTMALYAAFLRYTAVNYIVARVIVSVFAGLTVFLLNAVLNFRRL